MSKDLISTIARVECSSQGRGEEIPVAVIFGNERFEIVDILDRAILATVAAGDPVRHRLWVALTDGRRCQLVRELPDGSWRVTVER